MPSDPPAPIARPRLWIRPLFGGVLMGLANLVPGISGGTMLLAAGVYGEFIEAVAALTRMRASRRDLLLLLAIAAGAAAAVFTLAGPVRDLVLTRRWMMYSLFVGLTLGGVPTLWRRIRPADRSALVGMAAGTAGMVVLALAQQRGVTGEVLASGHPAALLFAGVAGAASMVLPGVSGGYLLLVLGQYLRILDAVDRFGSALLRGTWSAALTPAFGVLLPLAIGLAIGVALVSNLLRYLLRERPRPTLGVLIGLLLGAVVGLWPFQQQAAGPTGGVLHGAVTLSWPTAAEAAAAALLVVLGYACTRGVARLERGARTAGA